MNENIVEDLETVIKVLLKVSPEHRGWVEANWSEVLKKIEN